MSTHPSAAAMLMTARQYLGEVEKPAFSNHHPSVDWYIKEVENIGSAWPYCAGGVTREFWNAGFEAILTGRAYVPWMIGDFEDGKKGGKLFWIDNASDLVKHAQPGDVVFFDWAATKKHSRWVGDHVGVIEEIKNGDAYTIEHNTTMPGGRNEGTTRRVRDAKYVAAIGRPNWDEVKPPTIQGTDLPLLTVDGAWGPKTQLALSTIMAARGFKVSATGKPTDDMTREFIMAVQTDLNRAGKRDKYGKALKVDGRGIGFNESKKYPRIGWTRTISAMQCGHGVARNRADGYLSAGDSNEVRRIQRDANYKGTADSPFYNG